MVGFFTATVNDLNLEAFTVSIPEFSKNLRQNLKLELEASYERVTGSKDNNASNVEVHIDGFIKVHPLVN